MTDEGENSKPEKAEIEPTKITSIENWRKIRGPNIHAFMAGLALRLDPEEAIQFQEIRKSISNMVAGLSDEQRMDSDKQIVEQAAGLRPRLRGLLMGEYALKSIKSDLEIRGMEIDEKRLARSAGQKYQKLSNMLAEREAQKGT